MKLICSRSNDKVSAKAHDLRQKWIKLSNEQPAESGTLLVMAAVISYLLTLFGHS